ncbi:MAG: helix-turn-helix transcriptional regulator [Pirellulales bacterium]|nr:helix-turn-helix transcriptional regulator [Pirellulales bacterium]
MGKSQRVRLRDLRDIYMLVGECREVGGDPYAWNQRMLEGLGKILGARVGISAMTANDFLSGQFGELLGIVDYGWGDAADRQGFLEYSLSSQHRTDPTVLAMFPLPTTLNARRREELLPDAQWYRTPHFNEFYRRSHVDRGLFACTYPPADSGIALHYVNVFRGEGERPFSVQQRRMLWLFIREIRLLLGKGLAIFGHSPGQLSPRLQQVLALLLDGDSEKQIARALGLSPHTVHTHVKRLHRYFQVASRGELLARCRNWQSSGMSDDDRNAPNQ